MTHRLLFGTLMLALTVLGADKKSLPNQAGNSKLSLNATAITDRKDITALLGVDLGEGYIVVQMKATPQALEPLRLTIDDFTLISRKNGERSGAFSPSAIAGSAVMVVQPTFSNLSISSSGMGMPIPTGGPGTRTPVQRPGIGNSGGVESAEAQATMTRSLTEDPRLEILEAKVFPDAETKDPVEGLLYFNLQTKSKPDNLGLIYSGQAGRLAIDFKSKP
jgi:hypothetical protein